MENGFYLMYRGWYDHPVFGTESYCKRAAFEWLIANAAHGPRSVGVLGKTIPLERGELSYSTRFLARKWGWSEAKVRRFLSKLSDEGMIRVCQKIDAGGDAPTDAGQTIVTICNYNRYQIDGKSETQVATQVATQERRTSDAKRNELKERKEVKEGTLPGSVERLNGNGTARDSRPWMWEAWLREFGDEFGSLQYTEKRRGKLGEFYREHLAKDADPKATFALMLKNIRNHDWWHDKPQMWLPERSMLNKERREEVAIGYRSRGDGGGSSQSPEIRLHPDFLIER